MVFGLELRKRIVQRELRMSKRVISSIWLQRLIILFFGVILYLVSAIHMPMTEMDEARFSSATYNMVTSGDYIVPSFNGEPRYQKPILYYWFQAASINTFGKTEWAARIPSAIFGLLLVLAIHTLLHFWLSKLKDFDPEKGKRAAFLSVLGIMIVPLLWVWTHSATTDMLLSLNIGLSILALLHMALLNHQARENNEKVSRKSRYIWYSVAIVFAALAVLTKGPVGIAVPIIIWLAYYLYNRELLTELKRVPWWLIIPLFVLIVLPWYCAANLQTGGDFMAHFLGQENIGRFSDTQEGHGGKIPFLYFLSVMIPANLFLAFPLTPFIVHEMIYPFNGEKQSGNILAIIRRFAFVGIISIFAIFSLSSTQLPSYTHSVVTPLALMFAVFMCGYCLEQKEPTKEAKVALKVSKILMVTFTFLLCGGVFYAIVAGGFDGKYTTLFLDNNTKILLGIPFVFICGYCIISVVCWFKRNPKFMTHYLVSFGILALFLVLAVAPIMVQTAFLAPERVGRAIKEFSTERDGITAIYDLSRKPSEAVCYYSEEVVKLGFDDVREELIEELKMEENALVIVRADDDKSIVEGGKLVYDKDDMEIYEITND